MDADLYTFRLASGAHPNPQQGTCFMEAVAWMAREPHSDRPQCACPVLGTFGIRLNDRMTDDERKALNPLIIKMMNTRSDAHEEVRAAHLIQGVVTRILVPIFEARGWGDVAAIMRAIPVGATRSEMLPNLRTARELADKKRRAADAAYAAYYAADAAAYAYAAYDAVAAYDAAYAADAAAAYAAYYAADAAAYADAAYDAAAAAAYDAAAAAYDAAAAKLRPLWLRESVAILSEAINLGPHNGDEFYDIAERNSRINAFRTQILERADG